MTPCESCGQLVAGDEGAMIRHRTTCQAPVFCACVDPHFDKIGQCRRCGLADLRSPRMAETAALLDWSE